MSFNIQIMDFNKNSEINQKIDNELKKKEIEKKYGMQFTDSSKLSPEMEKEWLEYIENFRRTI